MKVATFKINNINKRLDNLLAWLKKAEPDVVSLQELKAEQEAFPVDALRTLGYEAVWQGERSWNGVAILARNQIPVVTRTSLPGNSVDHQARYIEFRSRLRIPIGEVDGSDQDSLNRRFNVASLMIFRISRQTCASQHGILVSRENGHAVPGALSLPDCFVTESPKGIHGKGFLLCLELLEANYVRFSFP